MLKLLATFLCLLSFPPTDAFSKTPADSLDSPFQIISDYIIRETRGDFFRSSQWLNNIVLEPEKIPGYDSAILIKSFSIDFIDSVQCQVKYKVTYQQFAILDQDENGMVVDINPDFDIIIFELKLIDNHWLIVSPISKSHLFPKSIIARLTEKEQEKLKPFLKK